MSDTKKNIQIANYLVKYMQDECDEEEKLIIERWLKNHNNKEIYQRIKDEDALDAFDKHDFNFLNYKNDFTKTVKKSRYQLIYRRLSYALILIFIVSIPFLFLEINNSKIIPNKNIAKIEKKKSSNNLPTLYTSDGEKIALGEKTKVKSIKENNGVTVNIKGDTLSYKVRPNTSKKIAYNTIKVPKASDFYFKLNDGTKVWLNSSTVIKYPIPFHKDRREIFLDGEAYFEVAKNKKKPFIINLDKGKVKVLGTKFNIKSYKDEEVATTLLSGSVKIEDKFNHSVLLEPSHQAIFNEKGIETKKVDPYLHICWKEGYFVYNNVSLDDILKKLSDWYDFEYMYKNKEAGEILLTAKIKKYNDFEYILGMLQKTGGIKFVRKGKMVIIGLD